MLMKKLFNWVVDRHISNFEINFPVLNAIVRCFYGLLAIIWYAPFLRYVMQNWDTMEVNLEARASWLWPAKWVAFFPEKSLIALILFLGGFLFSLACTVLPHKRWFRALVFLFSFQSLALQYSPVKIDHSYHALLFVSFWLIFMNLNKSGQTVFIKERNKFFYWMAQISFLGTYFLSGLWKLRHFIANLTEMGWTESPQCLVSCFAWEYVSHNMKTPFHMGVLEFFEGTTVNHLLWMGVILFQIFAPVPSWFPPIQRFYGVLIILFHISLMMLMDLRFFPNQCVALILLVCHPYQRKK